VIVGSSGMLPRAARGPAGATARVRSALMPAEAGGTAQLREHDASCGAWRAGRRARRVASGRAVAQHTAAPGGGLAASRGDGRQAPEPALAIGASPWWAGL
jgi:hypothetical protein